MPKSSVIAIGTSLLSLVLSCTVIFGGAGPAHRPAGGPALVLPGAPASPTGLQAAVSAGAISGDAPTPGGRSGLTPELLRDALAANPGVITDAIEMLRGRDAAAREAQDEETRRASVVQVGKHRGDLFPDGAPFIGNPAGSTVVVEFFDYQCPYCRAAEPGLRQAVAGNPDLKIVFRDMPIEGPASVLAARAAIAAGLQGKYVAMHDALLRQDLPLTEDRIGAAVREAGLDISRLRTDILDQSGAVSATLAATEAVAHNPDLGISATPTFVADGAGILKGFGTSERFDRFLAQIARDMHVRP